MIRIIDSQELDLVLLCGKAQSLEPIDIRCRLSYDFEVPEMPERHYGGFWVSPPPHSEEEEEGEGDGDDNKDMFIDPTVFEREFKTFMEDQPLINEVYTIDSMLLAVNEEVRITMTCSLLVSQSALDKWDADTQRYGESEGGIGSDDRGGSGREDLVDEYFWNWDQTNTPGYAIFEKILDLSGHHFSLDLFDIAFVPPSSAS